MTFPYRMPKDSTRPLAQGMVSGWWRQLAHTVKNSSGTMLVEMAVVMPLFLMVIIGTFQFSVIMLNYESAGFAVRQAARYGSTHSSTSLSPCTSTQITAMTQQFLWVPTGSATVTVNWPNGNTVGSTIKVTVSETYAVGLFNSNFSSVTISASDSYPILR